MIFFNFRVFLITSQKNQHCIEQKIPRQP